MDGFLSEAEARKLAERNLCDVVDEIDTSMLAEGVKHYKGKVRENFTLPDKSQRVLLTTDCVSVYDHVVGTVPFKGQVLDEIAHWWFEKTKTVVPDHVIYLKDSTITLAHECEPFPVEMVVRAYLTGTSDTSIWTAYAEGKREFCGHRLPEGMRKNERLPYVMITPSTKAEHGQHDESITMDAAKALLPGNTEEKARIWDAISSHALVLFGMGAALSDKMGLILVDTKYEFGRTKDGRIVVMDEIHTPDSSRFWEKGDYASRFAAGMEPKQLSKQFVREAIDKQGYKHRPGEIPPPLSDANRIECAVRYIMLCQRMTGRPFVPDTRGAEERAYRPLKELGVLR